MGPIKPNEVEAKKLDIIPEVVFESFNVLIAQSWSQGRAIVKQEEVIEEILKRLPDNQQRRDIIFAKHWLDVEGVYKEAGWVVSYSSPDRGDVDYDPYFTFKKNKK